MKNDRLKPKQSAKTGDEGDDDIIDDTNIQDKATAELIERLKAETEEAKALAEDAIKSRDAIKAKSQEAESNKLAQDIAGIMLNMDDEQREAVQKALVNEDKTTLISVAKADVLKNEVEPLKTQLAEKDGIIDGLNTTINGFLIDGPVREAFLDPKGANGDPSGARFAVPEISKLFHVEDGKLVAKLDGPSNGLDKSGNPLTPATAAKEYLAKHPIFNRSSTSSNTGGDGEEKGEGDGPTLLQTTKQARKTGTSKETHKEVAAKMRQDARDKLKGTG